MPSWFDNLATSENPGPVELQEFVRQVQKFLRFVLENEQEFGFLWEGQPDLRALALETFNQDVSQGVESLIQAIPGIGSSLLTSHGLRGRPLRFKFKVLVSISRLRERVKGQSFWERVRGLSLWKRVKKHLTIRGWFKQICDAIDAILDSLVQAAGAGGIIKEFKDALSALAIVR
jgi:hypothetical protein